MRINPMQEHFRIVVIDDDEGIQDALRMLFEQAGYEVDVFGDGAVILQGSYRLPDLFVLDKQLPGVDGLQLCQHLKAHPLTSAIPVILISASTRFEQDALTAGADAAMAKPFRMKELLSRTQDLIKGELRVRPGTSNP